MKKFILKGILWKQTLQVNLVRTIVAGIIWGVLILIMMSTDPNIQGDLWVPVLMPVLMPIGYFLFYLPLGIVCGLLSKMGIPFIGLVSFLPAILIYPADPFVFFLHKTKPEWVPVERYRFIEPVLSIWVFNIEFEKFAKETVNNAVTTVKEKVVEKISKQACPYKGRILIDKDTKMLGFDWPAKATAFTIDEDWSVATPKDRSFGWIDTNGEIHKGRPFGDIDPSAIFSGGGAGLKISGSHFWAGNDKVGELVAW